MYDLKQWLSDLIENNDLKLTMYHEVGDTSIAVYEPTDNVSTYKVHVTSTGVSTGNPTPKTITIFA